MKREFLKNLNLEDEVIDKIMAENGKDIEKHKSVAEKAKTDLATKETELEGVKTQLTEANEKINGFKGMSEEEVTKLKSDYEEKYKNDTKALEDKIAKIGYDNSIEKFMSSYDFVSDFAKNAFIKEFEAKEFKLENGKFLGAEDFIKEFKGANEGVFKEEAKEDGKPQPYTYNPKGNSAPATDLAQQALNAVMGI